MGHLIDWAEQRGRQRPPDRQLGELGGDVIGTTTAVGAEPAYDRVAHAQDGFDGHPRILVGKLAAGDSVLVDLAEDPLVAVAVGDVGGHEVWLQVAPFLVEAGNGITVPDRLDRVQVHGSAEPIRHRHVGLGHFHQ